VSFTTQIKTGIVFFILWFAGINHLLGLFILTDPPGAWSGDLYFQLTDWAILLVFITALSMTIYQIKFNSSPSKKITVLVFLISAAVIAVSAFIQLPWQKQAAIDLKNGFAEIEADNFESAREIAEKYYNEKKTLNNGDVFYLNGLLSERSSPQEAAAFFSRAASWYKNHASLVSQDFPAEAAEKLAQYKKDENPGLIKRLWDSLRGKS
jgi:hypothetical protein